MISLHLVDFHSMGKREGEIWLEKGKMELQMYRWLEGDIGISYACCFFKVNLLKDSSINQGTSDVYVISWPEQQIAGLDTPVGQ